LFSVRSKFEHIIIRQVASWLPDRTYLEDA